MSDDSSAQSDSTPSLLLASPWHTLIVVVVWGLNSYSSAIQICGRWRLRFFVGDCGDRGTAAGRVVAEFIWEEMGIGWGDVSGFGIGVLLLIVATVVVSALGGHQSGAGANKAIEFLLPHNSTEMVLWVALSITAAICEEAIYRGYFQGQFAALTGNVPVGIVFSGLLFGGAHLYQGISRAFAIFLSAILYGVVVRWRGTVRPGIFAHGVQDAIAPVLIKLIRH